MEMYKTILVPVDGSELAESVFPHVEALVRQSRSQPVDVILIRVCEPARMVMAGYGADAIGQAAIIADQAAAAMKEDAEKYLAAVEKRLREAGLKVRTELLEGDPADEILEYAANNPVDLIAMATHGRSGISRWAYGSVASKVLRGIATPLLLVTPSKS
jgi:nucleotide-binding universal stress UspA family protein